MAVRASFAAQRAIYGRLAGDTTLNNMLGVAAPGWSKNIYYEHAAEGAKFPFVIFNKQSAEPIHAMKGGADAIENDVWLIRGTDRSDDTTVINNIAQRILELFEDYDFANQINGRTALYCRRISDVDFPEVIDSETYRHAGSTFRLYHQST